MDKACDDREGGKKLLKTLISPGLKEKAQELIEENEQKCPSPPSKPLVVEPPSPVPPASTSLQREDVEPIFNKFIEAWNTGQYTKQLNLLAKEDFESGYYEGEKYQTDKYPKYAQSKLDHAKDAKRVEASNTQFIPISDGRMKVSYTQHYYSFSSKNDFKYESWGTNELYFRRRNGKIEIFKEIFYRDTSKNK